MNLIKNEENDNKYIKNYKIINFIEIIEIISNNYILKFKFIFLDALLKEWYKINKYLIKEKEEEIENINSIYIYNCYKNILYFIKNIFNKYKIIYSSYFLYNIKIIYFKKSKLISIIKNKTNKNIIKKINWNTFKIINNNISLKKEIKEDILLSIDKINNKYKNRIMKLFMDKFIYRNINILKKEKSIKQLYIKNKNNYINNEEIFKKNILFTHFNKWENYSFKDVGIIFDLYFEKNKYFQCKCVIYIYKRRLKMIYNIFINKYKKYYSSKLNINEKDTIKKYKTFFLLEPLKKYAIIKKINIFEYFISFYYLITKNNFLSFCLLNIINKYTYRIKKCFMINFKLYDNKKKRNTEYIYWILSNIFSFNKYKNISFIFSSTLDNKILNGDNNRFSENQIQKINKYNKNNIINLYFYNQKKIIKILLIYHKYSILKKMKNNKNKKNYFLKWKIASKKYTYKDFIQNKNIIMRKIQEYKEKNKLMQHKLLKIKKLALIDKKRKNNNKDIINKNIINNIRDKNTLNKNKDKKEKLVKSENLMEKIMISENKTIDSNEFDNYFDELPLSYLENLENLKNKNEPIIQDLQTQINNLINEIDILSNE